MSIIRVACLQAWFKPNTFFYAVHEITVKDGGGHDLGSSIQETEVARRATNVSGYFERNKDRANYSKKHIWKKSRIRVLTKKRTRSYRPMHA